MESFYVRDDADPTRYHSTELTRGPWSPDAQHAGPPSALLGHVLERTEPRDGFQIGRVAVEILRPVPLRPLAVSAAVTRPGRSVELLEATLNDADSGTPLMKASAWRLRRADPPLELPDEVLPRGGHPGPDTVAEGLVDFPSDQPVGFHTAIDYRFVQGAFKERGPAICWIRQRVPTVAGEPTSPLMRALAAADSGNGVSATLDWSQYVFINTDLTVTLHRQPEGEWVCLDAVTLPQPHGIGMADTRLFDESGPIGRATQTLFVSRR